jgi:NAD(P)-dependent dehydrogenase (short-subunit alcohol dehydrogenase family)
MSETSGLIERADVNGVPAPIRMRGPRYLRHAANPRGPRILSRRLPRCHGAAAKGDARLTVERGACFNARPPERTHRQRVSMKLKDQVAIVTGAGRNIGEETAKLLASEGAKIVVVDLDKDRAERTTAAIKAAGREAVTVTADVSNEDSVKAMVDAAVKAFGRIDILVNNVAISDNKHILDITKEEWDRVLAVTLTSPFLCGKYVAKQMVGQNSGGRIVNVGSTSGFRGRTRAIAYTAAKGGVANLTRSMAVQLSKYKIRVNAVIPNKIGSPVGKDEFDPNRPVNNVAGRTGVPIDLARAVLFMVSEDSDFIYGDMLFVDGGASITEA